MNSVPVGSPNVWMQYVNNKDCSQGFCTLYCPQWCYIVFPPPPPFGDDFPDQSSGPNFSPLVITIICILAAAFLLVSYYAIISKYCIHRIPSTRLEMDRSSEDENIHDSHEPSMTEPWFVTTNGLDDAVIRSITAFKYKKAEGLSQAMDCSVCLSEFEEHDSLRLLPKCNHAFHVPCIDTWLKSHSNCPLCRANVACVDPSPPTPSALELSPPEESSGHGEVENATAQGHEETSRETSIEIRDELGEGHDHQRVRRSVSMDCIHDYRLSIANVLNARNSNESYGVMGERESNSGINTSRDFDSWMNRSHSSGRWLFSKNERRPNSSVIPL